MNNSLANTRLGAVEFCSIGKGIPVLFVHGGHSNCNETLCHKGFDTENFQLITPSRPGYGKTPLNKNISPKQAADLLIALLDHLSVNEVTVYGISAGGLTAIELASNYPERVNKLILASAISKKWLDNHEKIYKTAQVIFNPNMEKFTWGMVTFFSNIFPTMIAKSFYPQFSSYPLHQLHKDDVTELIHTLKHYGSKNGFLNDIDQRIADSTLTKIECPTLIIHSKNDNSVPIEHALHSHQLIKNSTLLALNNEWGHLFWIGQDANDTIKKTIEFVTA
ncbi:MAG: alpha/beta fold hydrolase [Flammeovirgaceae bacterium]